MKVSLSTILIMFSLIGSSQMIDFEEPDWQVAMDKAKEEGKLLMVYMNAIWCEPCLEMEQTVFQEEKVHDFYSDNFVNVPFDAEEFPGYEIADRYGVFVFPGFLFINTYGELIHKGCGFMDEEGFMALGEQAMSESASLMSYNKRYGSGEREAAFMANYSLALQEACIDPIWLVESYFEDLPLEEWTSEAAWNMINLNVFDPYSPQFEFLVANSDQFVSRYGADTVEAKIYDVFLEQFIQIYEGADLTLFANQSLQKLISKVDFQKKNELHSMLNLQYSELIGDWELYGKSAADVVREQEVTDPYQLNEFAWNCYLNVEDQKILNQAIAWMEEVLIAEKTATSMDTYASLLFKVNRTKEAIKWEKKALKMAEEDLEDLTHYQLQLSKFSLKD